MKKRFKKVLSLLLCIVMLSSLVSVFTLTASAASNDVLGIDTNTIYYIKNVSIWMYIMVGIQVEMMYGHTLLMQLLHNSGVLSEIRMAHIHFMPS